MLAPTGSCCCFLDATTFREIQSLGISGDGCRCRRRLDLLVFYLILAPLLLSSLAHPTESCCCFLDATTRGREIQFFDAQANGCRCRRRRLDLL